MLVRILPKYSVLGVAQQTFMRGIIIILAVALSEIGRMKKRA